MGVVSTTESRCNLAEGVMMHSEDPYLQLERACQQSQCPAEAAAGSRQNEPPSCRHASLQLEWDSWNGKVAPSCTERCCAAA